MFSRKSPRHERREPSLFQGGRPARRAPQAPKQRRRRSFLLGAFSVLFRLGVFAVIIAGLGFAYIWSSLDQKGLLQIPEREPGIMLVAADGTALAERGAFFGDEARLSELPAYVPEAVIAIEDRRFRSHFGVDPIGLIRALAENFRAGHVVQGGSTLTQQLAKNLFLKPDRTIQRKLQEIVLAIWLESHFSKDELLQLYLNRVYFGGGAVGIEKAAQTFFGKSAREVTLAEAAILAAVLKAPTNYNPLTHPDAANARAREVLSDMVEEGFITGGEAIQAIEEPASLKASDYVPATQYVVDYVLETLPLLVKDYDRSIVVETTIDPNLQAVAERSLRRRLSENGAKLGASQAAFVMLDPSGGIKALVGGKSYVKSQFNRVTKAKRQPGSAFKPFVYLTAIEHGYTPDSVEIDEPVSIGGWEPENYKHKYLGPVTLTTALAQSINSVAAKLAYAVSPQAVIATAHRLGITSELAENASIALGTSEVTPLELTAAFTPFANGGAPVQPFIVTRISTRDGEVLYERHAEGLGQAVSTYDLGAMNKMMRAVVTDGTGRDAQFGEFNIGGKTGTSQDYRDAWFIGYTAQYVAGVWVGNDDNSPMKRVTGGSIPAVIWKDVMSEAHLSLPHLPLPGEGEPAEQSLGPLAVNQNQDLDPGDKR
ncbi:MAG: transglycosylase domain-containing protein, partial [Hyphomicrobiales bacterium]